MSSPPRLEAASLDAESRNRHFALNLISEYMKLLCPVRSLRHSECDRDYCHHLCHEHDACRRRRLPVCLHMHPPDDPSSLFPAPFIIHNPFFPSLLFAAAAAFFFAIIVSRRATNLSRRARTGGGILSISALLREGRSEEGERMEGVSFSLPLFGC